MMELKSAASLSVENQSSLEVSREGLRSLLTKIETELLNSEVYSSVLSSLQAMLGEAAAGAELLLKAVSREAIRLTFQGFTSDFTPSPDQPMNYPPESLTQVQDATVVMADETTAANPPKPAIRKSSTPPPPPCLPISIHYPSKCTPLPETPKTDETNTDISGINKSKNPFENPTPPDYQPFYKRWKRLSKAEQEALAIKEREERFQEIGQKLQEARHACSLSLKQLHRKTMIPLKHLEALEKGKLEELPEDVYIRGFIRRIGNALGLDGDQLVVSLPAPAPIPITPPWSNTELTPQLQVKPIHLYLGYTALMAGAVGGVAWLSQQSTSANILPNIPEPSPEPEVSSTSSRYEEPTVTPGITTHQGTLAIGNDIAPPDIMG